MRTLIGLTLALFAVQGCGGSNKNTTQDDMSTPVTDGGGTADMPKPADQGTPADVGKGTLVLPAKQFVAVTSDDYVVGFTGNAGGLSVAPIAGGTVTVIDAASVSAGITGKTVFSWDAAIVGKLTAWTASLGTPRVLNTTSATGTATTTTDGSYVGYAGNASNGITEVVVGKLDGTGTKTSVITGVAFKNTACPLTIVGGSTGFLVSYCTSATATVATLAHVDATAATPTATTIDAAVSGFSTDLAGDKLWYLDATNNLFYAALGSAATQVDTNVSRVYLSVDGAKLVWTTKAGALKSAATSAVATVTTLSATGAVEIGGVSPNEAYAMVSDVAADTTTGHSNCALASLTTAGAPAVLVMDNTSVFYGPSFTEDSSMALFYDADANSVATLHKRALPTGTASVVATGVWNHNTAAGTKIVYMDNYVAGSKTTNGKADLSSYDLTSGSATLIVKGAQAGNTIATSKDRTKVIYDFQQGTTAQHGVYAASIQ